MPAASPNRCIALFQAGSPSVAKSGESGSGSNSMTLARMYLPLGLGSFHSGGRVTCDRAGLHDEEPIIAESPLDIHWLTIEFLNSHTDARQLSRLHGCKHCARALA